MLTDTIARFVIGGVLVALFALVGNCFEPRTFSGIFGAAPSVALATLAMTYTREGASYVAVEGRSMVGGAAALALYGLLAGALVRRHGVSPWLLMTTLWILWFGAAFGAWLLLRR